MFIVPMNAGALGGQKVLDSRELEFQVVVRTGNWILVLCRGTNLTPLSCLSSPSVKVLAKGRTISPFSNWNPGFVNRSAWIQTGQGTHLRENFEQAIQERLVVWKTNVKTNLKTSRSLKSAVILKSGSLSFYKSGLVKSGRGGCC